MFEVGDKVKALKTIEMRGTREGMIDLKYIPVGTVGEVVSKVCLGNKHYPVVVFEEDNGLRSAVHEDNIIKI